MVVFHHPQLVIAITVISSFNFNNIPATNTTTTSISSCLPNSSSLQPLC